MLLRRAKEMASLLELREWIDKGGRIRREHWKRNKKAFVVFPKPLLLWEFIEACGSDALFGDNWETVEED